MFDLIGDEDSTDEDGDIGVLVSLGDEIFSEGKKSRESNIGDSDNIRNGGKTAGRAIITWGGGIASLISKSEGTIVEEDHRSDIEYFSTMGMGPLCPRISISFEGFWFHFAADGDIVTAVIATVIRVVVVVVLLRIVVVGGGVPVISNSRFSNVPSHMLLGQSPDDLLPYSEVILCLSRVSSISVQAILLACSIPMGWAYAFHQDKAPSVKQMSSVVLLYIEVERLDSSEISCSFLFFAKEFLLVLGYWIVSICPWQQLVLLRYSRKVVGIFTIQGMVSGTDGQLMAKEKDRIVIGCYKHDVVFEKLTIDDPFLTKLIGKGNFIGSRDDPIPPLSGKYILEENDHDDNIIDVEYKIKKGVRYPSYNPETAWDEFQPILGMKFENPLQLKNALVDYGVKHGHKLWFYRCDNKSLLVYCGSDIKLGRCAGRRGMNKKKKAVAEGDKVKGKKVAEDSPKKPMKWTRMRVLEHKGHHCPFRLWASWMSSERTFQIKSLYSDHRCTRNYNMGSLEYRQAVLDSNPGSTCHIDVDVQDNGQNRFHRLYMCFKGVKDEWLSGCRKVIGIYGCFITHVCKGELLTAIGRDANNQIYPIAWAIVDVENTNNWCWFLYLLADDLQLEEGIGLTIILDSHKGLIEAMKIWLPQAEHRHYTHHVYANFKKKWTRLHYKRLFWGAATSTLEQDFTSKMREIRALDEGAYGVMELKWVYGSKMWQSTINTPLLLPIVKTLPGRPRKNRIKHPIELDDHHHVSRIGRVMTCQKCWRQGHNKSSCTNPRRDKPYETDIPPRPQKSCVYTTSKKKRCGISINDVFKTQKEVGESSKRGGGTASKRGRGCARGFGTMGSGIASNRGRGYARGFGTMGRGTARKRGRGYARGSGTIGRGSRTMGRGSATVGRGSIRGGHVGSTAMDSRSKRGGTARKGFNDSNNTEENQIIRDKDVMHEVMQDVMDEEERLHAEKEQRLDSEREHNGRIYQDRDQVDWDQVSQDELFKGPTLSVLETVDEAIQKHNDGLPSISEESHTPRAPRPRPRPQIMPSGKSERIAKKRKFNYLADGTRKTPDKPFSL
ncbi:hypothetical protein Tco_0324473 [Tanacetum coccineum]